MIITAVLLTRNSMFSVKLMDFLKTKIVIITSYNTRFVAKQEHVRLKPRSVYTVSIHVLPSDSLLEFVERLHLLL